MDNISTAHDPATTVPALVSIGMPVYNGAAFLADALDSLTGQTYRQIEIVISDNASTDATEDICRSYVRRDARIRYERSPVNRGLAWNFRRVLEMARGTWYMYAPSDDLFAPDYVERCVEALERDPASSYVFATNVLIDAEGHRIGTEAVRQRLRHPAPDVRFWDVLVVQGGHNFYGLARRDMFKSVGRYPSLPRGERIVSAALTLRGPFVVLPADLYFRRVHGAQITAVRHDRRAELQVVDPRRSGVRASTGVVLAEYVLAYVAVALRAPQPLRQRVRVLTRVGRWAVGHVPGLQIRDRRAHTIEIDHDGPAGLPDDRAGIGY